MSEIIPPAPPPEPRWEQRVRHAVAAPGSKFGLLCVLLLLMLIPAQMVSGIVAEREVRQREVEADFAQSWGPAQALLGPVLVVPYGEKGDPISRRYLVVSPSQLQATAQLGPERRRRGLFGATVYSAQIHLSGAFQVGALPPLETTTPEIQWRESRLILTANDLRGMRAGLHARWNGQDVTFTDAEAGRCGRVAALAQMVLDGPPTQDRPGSFDISLTLRGSKTFTLLPLARETRLQMESPWRSPSFVGAFLPEIAKIGADGFAASWDMSGSIGSDRPKAVATADSCALWEAFGGRIQGGAGVELVDPASPYQAIHRVSKYTTLFLAVAFVTYFLFEFRTATPISLLRYTLLGFSVSLFALLLVSLAEPLGFTLGYALSAALVVLQGTLFTASIVRAWLVTAIFGVVQAMIFATLFVIIGLETYALLAGTGLLFLLLSAVMAATQRIDAGTRLRRAP